MVTRLQSWFGNGLYGIANLLMDIFCVFFVISIHEVGHGLVAHLLGDDTAKNMGRLSINPKDHLDPIGAICLFLFGFGWANPVPVNPRNFSKVSMKTGMVITSLAGPLTNIIFAFISLFLIKLLGLVPETTVVTVLYMLLSGMVSLNISLAVFNLIPIPPLDGYKILSAVLPPKYYFKLMQYERYGFIVLILFIYLPIFNGLLSGAVMGIYRFMYYILSFLPF